MAKKKELSMEEKLEQALVAEDEQPYKVPDNWVWTRLGAITKVIGGGTPSSSKIEFYENGNIPWIRPADLSEYNEKYISCGKKNITELGLQKSSARIIPKGTVLLSSRAPIGYVVIALNELCTNQGFKNFLPSNAYVSEYLYWYLKNSKEILEAYASGTTFLELSGSKAALVEVPIAPLTEQQRIVDRIESLFTKLDDAKELAQKALDTFETRKAAILNKAFTGELTSKWREENSASIDSWKETKLGELLYPMVTKKPDTEKETFKYIDIDSIDNNTQTVREPKTILVSEAPSRASRCVETGNVLFSLVRPYLKNIAYIDVELSECIASTGFYVCRCKQQLNSKFLYNLLCSQNTINYYTKHMKGDNSPSIRKDDFKGLIIKLPTLPEQQEIVRILDSLLEKEQKAKELCNVIKKIDLMKKAILARAFRGELGTNDPNEESAVELLKECLK